MLKYLLLLSIIIISCSSDVKLLKIHRDFTYENYSTNHFYITPLINNTGIPSFNEADIRLEKALKNEKKNLIIYGANYTMSKITDQKELALVTELINKNKSNVDIDKEKIILLSKYLRNGYIIFSSIDDFSTNEREYSQPITIHKGNKIEAATEYTKEIKSTIYGSFYIFNLKSGQLCFYAEHERSEIKSSSHTQRGCFDSCLFSIVDSIFSPGLTPVGANDMAEYLFKDFAKAIPSKGEKIEKILTKDNRFELK